MSAPPTRQPVALRDCAPRDGLQPLPPVPVAARVALVGDLFAAGLADVEVAAFVSPTAVPAMAGPAEVLAAVAPPPGARAWVLVPNRRGAELAVQAGATHLTVIASASEAYSEKNVGMSVRDALAQVDGIRAVAPGAVLDAVVSCAFGASFGEPVSRATVAAVCRRLRDAGVDRLTLADTTGVATPGRITAVLAEVGPLAGPDVGLHLHDTRATALTNAWAALALGVRRFDTALGGLGGSPFAPGAGGNLATEDLVLLLDAEAFPTGVDLEALIAAGARLAALVGRPLPSRVAAAGPIRPEAEAGPSP